MALLEGQPRPIRAIRDRLNLSRIALAHPWITVLVWVGVAAAGAWAFSSLKYALFPDIAFPVVTIEAHNGQTWASETEKSLTDPLEAAVADLPNLTQTHSLTFPGKTYIDLSFDIGNDLEAHRDAVAQAIAGATIVGHIDHITAVNLNETSVVTYAVHAPSLDLPELTRRTNATLVPALSAVPGVLKVEVLGGQTMRKVQTSAVRYDGVPAVAVSVVKRANANTLDVADGVTAAVDRMRGQMAGLTIDLAQTQATYVREASRATAEALGIAMLLAIVVIQPFLRNWRATAISALAIPTSLLTAAIVMALFHFNLETITMLALALVVGVIVDDAIVDVENIVRHLDRGEPPKTAALNATNEIGLTVTAATLTIVAVFLPIGLMRGTLGQFFKPFGITASAAVLASLLVARTLSPVLAAWWLKPGRKPAVELESTRTIQAYRALLAWSLDHRKRIIWLALGAFAAGIAVIPLIPKGFVPNLDRGAFVVNFVAAPGTKFLAKLDMAKRLERSIKTDPAVADVFTQVETKPSTGTTGTFYVRLHPVRDATTIGVENRVRSRLPAIAGATVSVGDIPFVESGNAKPVEVSIVAATELDSDLATLLYTAQQLQTRVQKVKGITDVSLSGLEILHGYAFEIEHLDRQRAITLSADLTGGLQIGDATDAIVRIYHLIAPRTIKLVLVGGSADVVKTFGSFAIALAVSIIAIVGVLYLLFRNWLDPLVIVISLPLSLVGAMLALFFTRADFGLISLMGVIFLFGLVNKNAILLVERIDAYRRLGMRRREAVLTAGSVRLRPIFMTTAATILGMLPIALGFGAGAELRAPMAVSIIGGLATSTLLSLVVVPVVYTVFDDLRQLPRRRARRRAERLAAQTPEARRVAT